jgi:molybdopterin-biosynthesis enzyme MoeA-like protein
LVRAQVIGDERSTIASEINTLRHHFDLLVTSGGIGPTHDDVTVDAIADAFGVKSYIHPVLEQKLRDYFQEKTTPDHLRMALVPEGAELFSIDGAAWPSVAIGNVWMLPGIPELFRARLAILKEHIVGPVKYYSRSVLLEEEEITLKPALDATVKQSPHVEIGSYPRFFSEEFKTQITFDGEDQNAVDAAVALFVETLPAGFSHKLSN